MNKKIKVEIVDSVRLDKYLSENIDKSRSEIQHLINENFILVNERRVKPSLLLKNCDEITIIESPIKEANLEKLAYNLDILYEDDDVIVVNKPSGMVTHPAVGHANDTLANALMNHCGMLSTINGVNRPGIVHRIDKDTSGLIVACKNDYSHNVIAEELKNKETYRIYYCLCYGNFNHQLGKIDAPIARSKQNRLKMAVCDDGKEAITHFKVLESFNGYSLLEVKLETGRTHQIRVHLAYINHPVLNDPLYGPTTKTTSFGQYLHAKKLGFVHPRTKKEMLFESELPNEFLAKIEELRNLNK